MNNYPPVLDACCGSRMFWFDREDERVVFVDNRSETHVLKDISSTGGSRTLEIRPDIIADFKSLPFPDNSFSLVVFDPPHFKRNGKTGWMAKKYGILSENWSIELTSGFRECFRVLRSGGVLVFKWNENEIPVSKILSLTKQKPLFGNKCGKNSQSHWICFMKGPNE
jgi:SAM-dependent methyltransferase